MTLTEKYKRICTLANCDKMTVRLIEGLFVIEAHDVDGQGDTLEDAFDSLVMHAEADVLRCAKDAEEAARILRAKLSGERT